METAWRAILVRGFHWYDALDIIAVALLVYYALTHVRGTRAVQMMVGIFALLAANFAAGWFHMASTQRMLQNVLFYIPFAVIVLFRDTIRRALASLGGIFFGQKIVRRTAAHCSEEVSRACFALAGRRHGALIVLEQTQGLKNFAESGVSIGAEASADLLMTIFYPGTPLHDGAVIISEGQIAAAGCFLPLTAQPLPMELGTRHRAAAGITETTDALCVVVSEERGTVTLVREGEFEPMETEAQLKTWLCANLSGGKKGAIETPAAAS
ncbi:MAG: TIGR00159 family protein [Acidobacteria bacterium]|nr:TIGR00159 family protein [Acidobacteriota bacterium]